MFIRETRSIITIILGLYVLFSTQDIDVKADHVHIKKNHYTYLQDLKEAENQKDIKCEDGKPVTENYFAWQDYSVVIAMLLISCGVGVFFACFGKKAKSSDDFLLGGSDMGTWPMSMSLCCSFITAIELLGNPAEMYLYGSQYWMICLAFIIVVPITSKIYLPVYLKLRLTSSFEYLQMRFNSKARYLASALYILQMVIYTSVAVYAPALALSHETGLNVYLAVTIVYVVVVFYASQGGMKAVIIADTFQLAVLIGSLLLIVFFGEKFVGGTGVIWSENYNTDRLEIFNMNPDPTVRHTFWSVVIGGSFYWLSMFCSNQASVQKYLAVETISQVRSALWGAVIGLIFVFTLTFYIGMIMVAHYRNCDPIGSNQLFSSDELLPLYVVAEMGYMKGLTGFFISGIFAASLGTVAAAINSLSAVTCQDFISEAFGIKMEPHRGALWAKCISAIYGVISFGLVFVVEQLGNVMTVALTFNGMVGGVTLGLFSLGMFFPWANSKGACFGGTLSLALVMWIGLGQQIAKSNGEYVIEQKSLSVDSCLCFNSTAQEIPKQEEATSEAFVLYEISYLWYSFIGFFFTILFGLIISLATGTTDPQDVDEDLWSPPFRNIYTSLPKKVKKCLNLEFLQKTAKTVPSSDLKGVDNCTLDIKDEEQILEKYIIKKEDSPNNAKRKISAP